MKAGGTDSLALDRPLMDADDGIMASQCWLYQCWLPRNPTGCALHPALHSTAQELYSTKVILLKPQESNLLCRMSRTCVVLLYYSVLYTVLVSKLTRYWNDVGYCVHVAVLFCEQISRSQTLYSD